MKQAKKIRVTALFVALLCSLWFCLPALAALNGAAWATVTGQQAVLYLQGADQNAALQCQVGNTPVEVQQTRPLSELELPRQTVILLDNSLSIPQSQRTLVQTILGKVADNSLPGEQFTIATLSKDVNYLCQDQPDLATVKSVIDALQYSDQATQLSDGLYEVLQTLLSRQDGGSAANHSGFGRRGQQGPGLHPGRTERPDSAGRVSHLCHRVRRRCRG